MAIPKTDKEYVAKLKLAESQLTGYWNQYPYNLGYYHKDGRFTFDCVNLNKAILNGWEPVKTVGYFVNNLSRTGDCDEWGFISQCEYSNDFSKMNCVSALYMQGHIGNYINEEVVRNGKIYNCIECTANSWGTGVVYSYIDSQGRRFSHKGGIYAGQWTYWGKMSKWLKYSKEPKKKTATIKCRVFNMIRRKWMPMVKSTTSIKTGMKNEPIGGFAFKINRGTFKYCVMDDTGWLPPVSKYDYKDTEYGMAGQFRPIYCVAIWTSDYKIAYRVKDKITQRWYPWVYSNNYNLSDEEEGYAGDKGREIDAIECRVVS